MPNSTDFYKVIFFDVIPVRIIVPCFELIKNNANIRGITIFNHAFLQTAFTDDSTFFLNDLLSVTNPNKNF